jgi:hypothetical protein
MEGRLAVIHIIRTPAGRYLAVAAAHLARTRARYPWTVDMFATVLTMPEGPWVQQGPATDVEALKVRHSAASFRRMLDAAYQQVGGVVYQLNNNAADLKVSASGVPDGFVHVAAGSATVRGTQAPGAQGMYHLFNDATVDINVLGPNPAHATLDRIDLVVLRIQDSFYAGGVDTATVEMVTGTPAGSPVAPAAPANSLPLAQLSIIHATPTIPAGVVTERRLPAGRLPIVFDDQSGAGPTASVNIVVPPGFRTIVCDFAGRCDQATAQSLICQFNGDVGANYDDQLFQSINATVSGSTPLVANASGRFGALTPSGAVAGAVHASHATIQNADSVTLRKQWLYDTGGWDSDAAAGARKQTGQGQWRNTVAAINAILLKSGVGNLINWRAVTSGIPA